MKPPATCQILMSPQSSSVDSQASALQYHWFLTIFFSYFFANENADNSTYGFIDWIKVRHRCLVDVDAAYPEFCVFAFAFIYILLQSFAIPAPAFMNILSGTLWPYPKAISIIAVTSTIGASNCFTLSKIFKLGSLLRRLQPTRYESFREKLEEAKQRSELLWYIVFLRITPLFPNWAINLLSPALQVPLTYFAAGTFLGYLPVNSLQYMIGKNLADINDQDDFLYANRKNFAILFGLQFVALIPTFILRFTNKKDKEKST